MYKPSFDITINMLKYCISITEKISKISSFEKLEKLSILRKNNKIKSVHYSLQIEANSLTLDEVKDVINGKKVLGPLKEIQEVKNAYKAYSMINQFDCYSLDDLLVSHSIITNMIEDSSGKFRKHAEGVFDGAKVIFVAPPHDLVPQLMYDLFDWLNNDEETPLLIKSCVFHYELVFIHPFSDGNGRVARFWQTLLLMKWKSIFEYIPIETYIKKYQDIYYERIDYSHHTGTSNAFIEFMLKIIDETLDQIIIDLNKESITISYQINKLLSAMEKDIFYSANELMILLNIKSKETLRNSYLNKAISNGLIEMMLPDKPNSKNQKYIKK